MASGARVTTTYRSNNLPKLQDAMKRLKSTSLSVGVHSDAGRYPVTEEHPDPPSVAVVALAMEYGTDQVPARPFFYPTLSTKEPQIKALVAKAYAMVSERFVEPASALASVGFAVQVWLQNTIKSNVGPSLGWTEGSKRYLARRRQTYPESGTRTLIASGLLLRSILFKVWDGDQVVYGGSASAPEPITPTTDADRDGRAKARRSAADYRQARKNAQSAAKANQQSFRQRFLAQKGSHGLPEKGGHK